MAGHWLVGTAAGRLVGPKLVNWSDRYWSAGQFGASWLVGLITGQLVGPVVTSWSVQLLGNWLARVWDASWPRYGILVCPV